jgi:ATP-dependent protease ClpP protease subunit
VESKEEAMNNPQPLNVQFPAGCYIGFNAALDRKASEQLAFVCGDAVRNGYKEITLCLTSVGGLLDFAYYAYNLLEALPIKIVTHNIGSVQSAANLIYLCGDERYSAPVCTFFFHNTGFDPAPGQQITGPFITEKLKAIEYEENRAAAIYAEKTGLAIEKVSKWQQGTLVMDGDTAVKNGLAHAVKPLSIPPGAFFHQIIV